MLKEVPERELPGASEATTDVLGGTGPSKNFSMGLKIPQPEKNALCVSRNEMMAGAGGTSKSNAPFMLYVHTSVKIITHE